MLYDDLYLAHYGVKGMRWGVRKAEVRADNKKAKNLGDIATVNRYASEAAERRANKYTKKYGASTKERHQRKLKSALMNRDLLKETADESFHRVKEHYDSLVKKYGKENVKDIKYNKKGLIEEGRDTERALRSLGITAVSVGAAIGTGLPFAVISVPLTSRDIGNSVESMSYRELYKGNKNKE